MVLGGREKVFMPLYFRDLTRDPFFALRMALFPWFWGELGEEARDGGWWGGGGPSPVSG